MTRPGPAGSQPMDAWEIELVPVPIALSDTADARPGIVLVVDSASGFIVQQELLAHSPSSPREIARVLAANVRAGAEAVGRWPRALWVRHQAVADALEAEFRGRDLPVMRAAIMPSLDEAITSLLAYMDVPAGIAGPSIVETWAGWGQPPELVAALFTAAAAFYRAVAWRWITNVQVLEVRTARGGEWAVTVLGNGGQEFGLALYEDPEDLRELCEERSDDPDEHFANLGGGVISLTFSPRRELPRRMRQEVAAARWEVAGRQAYPVIVTVNTPGGGIAADAFLDLIDLLQTIPRFVAQHTDVLSQPRPELPIGWTDEATGVAVTYTGFWGAEVAGRLWALVHELSPALAEGPGARPEAVLEEPEDEESLAAAAEACVEAFRRRLATAGRPRSRKDPSWLGFRRQPKSAIERHVEVAAHFLVDFIVGYRHIPIEAISELDLRVFLYDWYPRKVYQAWSDAQLALPALIQLFDFLAVERGLYAPWAGGILEGEAEAYQARFESFPGGYFWDEDVQEWQAELYENLAERILLHDVRLGDRDQWGPMMGISEALLDHELDRRWLLWRDEVIRAGSTDPGRVFEKLRLRQRAWEQQRHPAFGNRTPIQVIRAERREMEQRLGDHGRRGPAAKR
jgi:hypothetical protein